MSEQAIAVSAVDEPRFRIVGEHAALFGALAKAMPNFKPIERNKTVRVRPKDNSKAEYEFSYAPLEVVVDATRGALAEQGLVISQPYHSARGGWLLRTILAHSSGAYIEALDFIPGGERTSNQDLGGILTYRRRYSYSAMLGLTSEDDDDANAADGNAASTVQKSSRPKEEKSPPNGAPPKGRSPAKATISLPPGWPDTDVTNLCNWINGLAANTAAFKFAFGALRENAPLYSSLPDWEPVLKAFTDRLRKLILDQTIPQKQRDAQFEDEVRAEAEKLKTDKAAAFTDEPTPGTEADEPAHQTS